MDDSFAGEPIGTRMVYEDARVRVWTLELGPGESTTVHAHDCDYVYVAATPGETVTHVVDGTDHHKVDRCGDSVYHDAGLPHRLENLGSSPYMNVIVELVGQVRAGTAATEEAP